MYMPAQVREMITLQAQICTALISIHTSPTLQMYSFFGKKAQWNAKVTVSANATSLCDNEIRP
jgi:hypothetical protein